MYCKLPEATSMSFTFHLAASVCFSNHFILTIAYSPHLQVWHKNTGTSSLVCIFPRNLNKWKYIVQKSISHQVAQVCCSYCSLSTKNPTNHSIRLHNHLKVRHNLLCITNWWSSYLIECNLYHIESCNGLSTNHAKVNIYI